MQCGAASSVSWARQSRLVAVPMPISVRQFYLDERRRTSQEISYGLEWTLDRDPGAHYGIHWIEVTKEVYALRGPIPPAFLQNTHYGGSATIPPQFGDDQYQVVILGTVESKEILEKVLGGWQERMRRSNSLEWVEDRLRTTDGGR